MKKKGKKVMVGLSGGVDSAVSAYLLKKEGYDVVGAFIKAWHPPFFSCPWKEDRLEAMRVAANLGIPFITVDLEKEYEEAVGQYLVREYREGRTPNPDVYCNRDIKFGAFLKYATSNGADFVATGHYAQIKKVDGFLGIYKGVDPKKDQSYFLWTLTEKELSKIIFPLGGYTKEEVRRVAKRVNLPNADKKDSQGICFVGPIGMKEFLSAYIQPKRGDVKIESGEVIGEHDGASFLTLGERHGFSITKKGLGGKTYYVIGKDIKNNIVTVSENPLPEEKTFAYTISNLNIFVEKTTLKIGNLSAQIRYHGEYTPASIEDIDMEKGEAVALFDKPTLVSPGQSIVFYRGDRLIAGGIAENPHPRKVLQEV